MAKKSRRNQANPHRELLSAYAVGDENIAARMAHRSSGAAGPHAKSLVDPVASAGRRTRVGSRSSRRRSALKDQEE